MDGNRQIIKELVDLLQKNDQAKASGQETSATLLDDLAGIAGLARRINPVNSGDKVKIQELCVFTTENSTKLEEWQQNILPGFDSCTDSLNTTIKQGDLLTSQFLGMMQDWRKGATAVKAIAARTGPFAKDYRQWQNGMDGCDSLDAYLAGLKKLADQLAGIAQAVNQAAAGLIDTPNFISEADRKGWIPLLVQETRGTAAFLRRMQDIVAEPPAYSGNEARGSFFILCAASITIPRRSSQNPSVWAPGNCALAHR